MKAKNLGIFASVFASICCVGPLVLILLGLGTLGIGAIIGKYHWWFVGGGIFLISIAWKYYFKEKRACDLKTCQMENKKAALVTLIIATLIVTFFVGLNLYTYLGKSGNIRPVSFGLNLQYIEIPVEGMTCLTCELTVSTALKKINGVVEATASAKEKKVKVRFDPTRTNIEQLIETINKTGYKASDGRLKKAGYKTEVREMETSNVSFYKVPLICGAAPHIGCGSKSKPVLLELEQKSDVVSEAWLNRAGTLIAIKWKENAPAEQQIKDVEAVFKENKIEVILITGEDKEKILKDFENKQNWYLGADVDKLSMEEANVIAERLVNRINSKTPINKDKIEPLKKAFVDVFKKHFTENYGYKINRNNMKVLEKIRKQREEDLLAVGQKYLNENQMVSLKYAIALGFRPTKKEIKD